MRSRSGSGLYLKVTRFSYVARELEQEVRVLKWLRGKGLSAPKPLRLEHEDDATFFLMSEVPGASLAELAEELGPSQCMRLAAKYLRTLHSINVNDCPFERHLNVTLAKARENIEQGLVDEGDFDRDHQEKPARVLYQELMTNLPKEDLVFTHGDYCFPNIIVNEGQISGVVDLGRAGVADRYQDIALFLRSFRTNRGEPDLELFLREYGLISALDQSKQSFFRKLDEFF
jgi:aminoglycoside phosphotransferase